jgi:hypothetical protein
VVVIPGRDGAHPGAVPPCDACGTTGSGTRVPFIISENEAIVLCLDGHECATRYRHGASPESYAAGLRGELLAVAP